MKYLTIAFVSLVTCLIISSCEELDESLDKKILTEEELNESSFLFTIVEFNEPCAGFSASRYDLDSDDGYFEGLISFVDGKVVLVDPAKITYNVEQVDGSVSTTDAQQIIFGNGLEVNISDYSVEQDIFFTTMTSNTGAFCDLVLIGTLL